MATKKKVTIVYDCSHYESVGCAVILLSKYRKDTVQTIDINGLSEGDITTAIGTLTGSQEYLYVAAPSTSNWTSGNDTTLKAKGATSGGLPAYVWDKWVDSAITETLSMLRDMWKDMAFESSPNEMIYLLGTPIVDLSDANILKRTKYMLGLYAKAVILNEDGTGVMLDTSSDTLKFVADAIDLGLWDTSVNSATNVTTSIPEFSRLNMYDILTGGEYAYNMLGIYDYIDIDESESSSSYPE